jgi:hypothetical protein
MVLKRNIKRAMAMSVSVCLACASIAPSIATACEGASIELEEGGKGKLQVSKANGFEGKVHSGGPAPAKNIKVKYEGNFGNGITLNEPACNGLLELAVGLDCFVKILCTSGAKIGDTGELIVEGSNFVSLRRELECVA